MTSTQIRRGLLAAGVKNLKAFGYPTVNEENILTNVLFKPFFKSMLEAEENKSKDKSIERVRTELLKEISDVAGAAEKLREQLKDQPWLTGVGVGANERIFVYTKSPAKARASFLVPEHFNGFWVELKKMGPAKPA